MKNKKLIKFQRKEILISNPLTSDLAEQKEQKPNKPSKQTKNNQQKADYYSMNIDMNEKLQIPKQMRIENIANKYKNKFVAMMDAEPLIKIDTLFENQIVCRITGNKPKNNRQSFGKKNKQQQCQKVYQEVIQQQFQNMPLINPIAYIVSQNKPNYLQLLSQGLPTDHISFNEPFQFQDSTYEGSRIPHQKEPSKFNHVPNSNFLNNNTGQFMKKDLDKYI